MEKAEKLTTEELTELMELYKAAQNTPVIALSVADGLAGRDFASQAYKRFVNYGRSGCCNSGKIRFKICDR